MQWSSATADARDFLDSLSAADPSLADAALTHEVDSVLGREPPSASLRERRQPEPPPEDSSASLPPRFDWFGRLVEQLPPLDDEGASTAAIRVEAGLLAQERLERLDLSTTPRQELADLHTLIEQGEDAWRWLILANLRLVFHWTKGVARSISPVWAEDAFQAGCIGLMRGLESWDHQRGYKLSTYVSWHIRQSVQRWRANEVQIIRLPVHVWEALNSEDNGLAKEVRVMAERTRTLASFEAMLDREEDVPWDGCLEDLDESLDREFMAVWLLDGLDERSRDIIERRFALRPDIDEPMTLDEIGARWGVTRERIRQLEGKILKALREKASGTTSPWLELKRKRREKAGR
ncbi:sigma-70 family RNA polymerase sigma factor [Demequina activiva]|uniref:RNA polymerase principal sigma factor HrdA n=1 Tax=Demequina activiva TaxID=1582364 RepID=A0A919UF65_9MICO|nr:sigma-70 family RNA polymerase sigma factor [Demequina activiva]GIG53337.1 RNA polymerase principal sigma factor HrdA [Demequina activiva]